MDNEKKERNELSRNTAWLLRNVGSAMREALNGSMAAAELLSRRLEKEARQDEQEYLAVLRHDQHRLLSIAENLCELGSLALGEVRAEPDVQDLNLICAELVESISALTDRVCLTFAPCAELCFVNGSRDRLESLVLNLLANSLRRCEDGDSIALRTERREREVCLYLRDNGKRDGGGSLSALYSALEQDPRYGVTQGGAGLGLLVAEGIARLYGGSLLLSTAQEGGTEAVLTLPRCKTNLLRVPTEEYGRKMRGILTIMAEELSRDKYMPPYL